MRHEFGGLVLRHTNIVVEDQAASSAGGQGVLIPPHHANTSLMAKHASQLGALFNVPDLDLTRAKANADVSSIARPLDTANIGVGRCLEQTADGARFC